MSVTVTPATIPLGNTKGAEFVCFNFKQLTFGKFKMPECSLIFSKPTLPGYRFVTGKLLHNLLALKPKS